MITGFMAALANSVSTSDKYSFSEVENMVGSHISMWADCLSASKWKAVDLDGYANLSDGPAPTFSWTAASGEKATAIILLRQNHAETLIDNWIVRTKQTPTAESVMIEPAHFTGYLSMRPVKCGKFSRSPYLVTDTIVEGSEE